MITQYNTFLWLRLKAAQIYGYKQKYLEGSLTALWFSKTTIVGTFTPPAKAYDLPNQGFGVYGVKHHFPLVE